MTAARRSFGAAFVCALLLVGAMVNQTMAPSPSVRVEDIR